MATKLTLKIGEGTGPVVVVHRLDRPWVLQLRGLGASGRAKVQDQEFAEDGDYALELEGRYVRCDAEQVPSSFRAELVMV